MNLYDRIINILLEARIEEYIERLDEGGRSSPERTKARVERQAGKKLGKAMKTIGAKAKHSKPHRVYVGKGVTKTAAHLPNDKGVRRAIKVVSREGNKLREPS